MRIILRDIFFKKTWIYLFFLESFTSFDPSPCLRLWRKPSKEKEIISFDEQQNKFPQNPQLFHAIILARRNEPLVVRETFFLPWTKSAKTFRFVSNPSVAGRQFARGKRAYKEPITHTETLSNNKMIYEYP